MSQPAELNSRDRMIEAAIELMRASGLSGAGINEIVRESGAPKGSVYHRFPAGKTQIATEALEVYSGRVMAFIDRALATRRRPDDKLKALFGAFARRVAEGDFRRSCAVGTVTLDLEPDMEGLRAVLAAALADWNALIARHFDFGDRRRTKSFAGLVLTAIEGAYIRCRAERSGTPFREAGAWLAEIARKAVQP
ncbi:MAG: TetR/AcrR family transcriptional regulator [Candidatus Levyibacteriota bacterium]